MVALFSAAPANFISNSVARAGTSVTDHVRKLSAGLRIERAADGAADNAVAARIGMEEAGYKGVKSNVSHGASLLQVVDGSMAQITKLLTRMRVLAVQASSGNLGNTERALLDIEYQELKHEVCRTALDTQMGDKRLLGLDCAADFPFSSFDLVYRVSPATVNDPPNQDPNGNGFADQNEGVEIDFRLTNTAAVTINNVVVSNATISTGWGLLFNTGATLAATLAPGATTITNVSSDLDLLIPAGTQGTSFNISMVVDFDIAGEAHSYLATFGPAVVGEINEGYQMPILTLVDLLEVKNPDRINTIRVGTGINPNQDDVYIELPQVSLGKLNLQLPATTIATLADAESAMQEVDKAMEEIIDARSQVGALINRVEYARQVAYTHSDAITAARVRIVGLDVAQGVSELATSTTRMQTAMESLARYQRAAKQQTTALINQIDRNI
ncbi:MAG: flagellin [Alphaproteobacteria bacterium]|nr:flagellin [Alphaproteobacteria bacterium]